MLHNMLLEPCKKIRLPLIKRGGERVKTEIVGRMYPFAFFYFNSFYFIFYNLYRYRFIQYCGSLNPLQFTSEPALEPFSLLPNSTAVSQVSNW